MKEEEIRQVVREEMAKERIAIAAAAVEASLAALRAHWARKAQAVRK